MKVCECGCGGSLNGLRAGARYATDGCRLRAHRRRTRLEAAPPAEDFHAWWLARFSMAEIRALAAGLEKLTREMAA